MQPHETTLASEWLCNPDFATHDYWRRVTNHVIRATHGPHPRPPRWQESEAAVFLLAERLKESTDRDSHLLFSELGLYYELLNTALDRVDWFSVAEDLVDKHARHARTTDTLRYQKAS